MKSIVYLVIIGVVLFVLINKKINVAIPPATNNNTIIDNIYFIF